MPAIAKKPRRRANESDQQYRERLAIADRIKARREYLQRERGDSYNQESVAKKFVRQRGQDLAQSAYSKYETGENQIAPADLPFLAQVLEVSVSYFYGEDTMEDVERTEEIIMFNGLQGRFRETIGVSIRAMVKLQEEYAKHDHDETTHGKRAE